MPGDVAANRDNGCGPTDLAGFFADSRSDQAAANDEPVLLFRSVGFSENLVETHPCA